MPALPALPRRYHAASIWLLYALGLVPAVWGFYLGATGQHPGNAIKEFEHLLGTWAVRFLIATLAISPLRDLAGINWVRYRRALGLLTFWYVLMHFLTYMILDQYLDLRAVFVDITRRPYIIFGMIGLVSLVPLALTSNNWSIRRLGPRWVSLHRLVYLVAIAAVTHFTLSVKVVSPQQWLYVGLITLLLAWRLVRPFAMSRRRRARASAAALARST